MKLTALKMGLFMVVLLATVVNKSIAMEEGERRHIKLGKLIPKSGSCYDIKGIIAGINIDNTDDNNKILIVGKLENQFESKPRPKRLHQRSKSYPDLGNKTKRELEKEIENLQETIRVQLKERADDEIRTLRMENKQTRQLFLALKKKMDESLANLSHENVKLKATIELLIGRMRTVEISTDAISRNILEYYLNYPSPEITRKSNIKKTFADEFYGDIESKNNDDEADREDPRVLSLKLDKGLTKAFKKEKHATEEYDITKSDTVSITTLKQKDEGI